MTDDHTETPGEGNELAALIGAALDRLPDGLLLVSALGRIMPANRAAEAILQAADGLSADRGELSVLAPR